MAETLQPVSRECDWYDLPCNLDGFGDWLLGVLLFIPRKIFELMTDGLASVIEAIPVPDFVTAASTGFSAIPPSVVFWVDFLQLPAGLAIVVAASIIRFTIRRIPFIG